MKRQNLNPNITYRRSPVRKIMDKKQDPDVVENVQNVTRLVWPSITPRVAFERATWKYANETYPQSCSSILFDAGELGICLLEWSGSGGGRWRNVWYDRLHSLSPENTHIDTAHQSLTRDWSKDNVEGLKKALRGGDSKVAEKKYSVCDGCGKSVNISNGGWHGFCSYVYGRRGWSKIGEYDG